MSLKNLRILNEGQVLSKTDKKLLVHDVILSYLSYMT